MMQISELYVLIDPRLMSLGSMFFSCSPLKVKVRKQRNKKLEILFNSRAHL